MNTSINLLVCIFLYIFFSKIFCLMSFSIFFTGAPEFLPPTTASGINIKQSSHVTLTCVVQSNPASQITWLHNNEHFLNASNQIVDTIFSNKSVTVLRSRLTLVNVTARDSGEYTCVANNSNNKLLWRILLNVLCKKII